MYNWEEIYKTNKKMDDASKQIGFDPLLALFFLPLAIITLPLWLPFAFIALVIKVMNDCKDEGF